MQMFMGSTTDPAQTSSAEVGGPQRGRDQRLALGVPRNVFKRSVLVLVGIAAILVSTIPRPVDWKVAVQGSARGTPVSLGAHPALCRVLTAPNGVVQIEGRVVLDALTGPTDIFQTAPLNAGIRMEITMDGPPGLDVATGRGSFTGMASIVAPPIGQPWSFVVTLDADGSAVLQVGGLSSTKKLMAPAPACNALVVGGGFDATRALHGTAMPISFKAGSQPGGVPAAPVVRDLGVVALVWVIAGSVAGYRREKAKRSLP